MHAATVNFCRKLLDFTSLGTCGQRGPGGVGYGGPGGGQFTIGFWRFDRHFDDWNHYFDDSNQHFNN